MTRFSLGRHARPRTGGLGPSPTAASSPPPARGQAFPRAWRSDWAPESRFHPNISHRAERRSNDGRGGRELQLRTEAHVSVTRSALLGGEAGDAACVARGRWLDRRARRAGRLSRGRASSRRDAGCRQVTRARPGVLLREPAVAAGRGRQGRGPRSRGGPPPFSCGRRPRNRAGGGGGALSPGDGGGEGLGGRDPGSKERASDGGGAWEGRPVCGECGGARARTPRPEVLTWSPVSLAGAPGGQCG